MESLESLAYLSIRKVNLQLSCTQENKQKLDLLYTQVLTKFKKLVLTLIHKSPNIRQPYGTWYVSHNQYIHQFLKI